MHFVRCTSSSIFLGNSRGLSGNSTRSGSQPPLWADAVTVGGLPSVTVGGLPRRLYSGEPGTLDLWQTGISELS